MDGICILYDSQISDIADFAQISWVLNKEVFFLRAKCDNAEDDSVYSFKEEIMRDTEDLKKIDKCPENVQVFATSKKGGFDN